MRIAHLISRFFPDIGGAQVCVHNIARRQAEAGHHVTVIVPYEFRKAQSACYEVEALRAGSQFALRTFPFAGARFLRRQLLSLQRRHSFDLWQVTIGYPLGIAAIDFFREQGIPCVLRCVGFDIQTIPQISYGVRLNSRVDREVRSAYPRYDMLVANSRAMEEEYKAIGVPEAKVRLIPNGIDALRFSAAADRRALKKRLCLPEDARVILTAGRNHPKKGFALIPAVIRELLKRRDDFVWLLVGEETQEIAASAKGLGLGQHLVSIGGIGPRPGELDFPSRDLIEAYKAADLFAFPTLIEGFPTVVIEAMAAGLPVVTTNAPGADELVREGVTGLKSPVRDAKAMAFNIDRLLGDSALLEKMRANALSESARFDWGWITRQYLGLYAELLE